MADRLSGSSILVTGGLGFIGHHLSDELIRAGARVTIVDNRSTSVVEPTHFEGRARVVLASMRELELAERWDWICHLASPVGPTRVMWAAGDLATEVVLDMKWVIDTCALHKSRVLLVSSSEVYGHGGVGVETDPLRVLLPYSGRREYSCAKMLAEVMLYNAQRTQGISALTIRPFNVVGPSQSSEGGFILPRFIEAVERGEDLTVYGDGTQRRCFTHVKDVASAMAALMSADAQGLFNIANPANETTILALAQRFQATVAHRFPGTCPRIAFVDPTTLHGPLYEEAPDKLAAVGKLFAAVAWRPVCTLDDILEDVASAVTRVPGHTRAAHAEAVA